MHLRCLYRKSARLGAPDVSRRVADAVPAARTLCGLLVPLLQEDNELFVRVSPHDVRPPLGGGLNQDKSAPDIGQVTRTHRRGLFKFDRYHIVHAVMAALAAESEMSGKYAARTINQYKVDPEKANLIGSL